MLATLCSQGAGTEKMESCVCLAWVLEVGVLLRWLMSGGRLGEKKGKTAGRGGRSRGPCLNDAAGYF